MTGDPAERPELPGRPIAAAELEARFDQWRSIVERMHATTRFTPNREVSWTPLTRPLSECTVSLVTTAGTHLRTQRDFDLMNEHGDPSYRLIPGDADTADLATSHSHYDTSDANADPNVVFPLDRLRELAAEGTVGAVGSLHVGMMGWNPNGERVERASAPEVARLLREAGADAVVLTPG